MPSAAYELRLAEPWDPAWVQLFPAWEPSAHPAGGTVLRHPAADPQTLLETQAQVYKRGLTLVALHCIDATFPDSRDATTALTQRLQEKEAQYRSIFEATSDGVVIRDPEGRIVEANPAYLRMHDCTREEMIGRIQEAPLDPERQRFFDDYLATVNAGKIFRAQLYQNDKHGRRFPVEALGIPFSYGGKPHILTIVRDISDRMHALEEVEQRADERTRELAALLEVSRQVASTLDLVPLLRVILTQVRTVIDYAATCICLPEGPDALRLMVYNGPIPQEAVPQGWSIGPARPPKTALSELLAEAEHADPGAHFREVFYSGGPVIIPDVRADTPLARAYRSRMTHLLHGVVPAYVGTWMGVPLIYRNEVIGVLGFDHGQPGAYGEHHARIAMAVASQAAVAIANARLLADVQASAAESERQRLARELHDAVTQQLFSASMIGEVLPQIWAANPTQAAEYLEDLRLLTKGALAEMRALLVELRPAALTDTPLPDLLQHLTTALSGRTRIPVTLRISGSGTLPGDLQIALYRIAQEALQNIAKHARAHQAWVLLTYTPGGVTLEIGDDGRGFDPLHVPGDHFGLAIMRERMSAAGGTVTLSSSPGQGTTVRASLARTTSNAKPPEA
jgi:two-component system nitrate/nitrite sensor histidine kinase NarX